MKPLGDMARKLEQVLSDKQRPVHIKGQMTLDTENVHRTGPEKQKRSAAAQPVTPLQRARMKAAAEAIGSGKKVIPLRCAFCHSTSLLDEASQIVTLESGGRLEDKELRTPMDVLLNCVTCGRTTRLSTARAQRRREVRAFIVRGVDVPLTKQQREAAARH